MAALPSEDFILAPIASDNADFIPAPIAQDDEDFIPSTLTPEQTVIEALAGVEGYRAAVQTAAEYGDNPTLRPLFVKALADRQKKQASKSTEDSLNDAAKIALALPGIAGRTLYSVVTESIPAVANNVKSLFAGNPAEQLQAVGEAGSAISGAAVSTLELLRKGYENVSDSVTFSKPSLSRGLEIARNPLLIAQPSKAILQSDEEYERRADADLLGAKTIKEAASGGLLPGGIREKAAALGSPIRPEVSEKLQVAYDPLNWVPFGAGFVVGKVGNALGLGVRTAGGVEVVAKGLQKLADVEKAAETVGVLRRGVGATVSGAGQKVVRASDSPAVVGTIAGATALAGGAEPVTAMLASLIGAGTVRGAGPVADVLKSSGRTLVRVGDQIAGKASLGPMGRFAESAVNFVKPSIVEGGQSGLALGLPFALSARDEQDVADVLGSSAAFGVGGHLVGQVVGAGNRYFSIDSAFRDSTAKVPDSAYERPEFSYYSQDQGNVVEAKSREVFDTLSNKGAQTVEALKKLFVKPDANGIKTEIYILDRATSDALAKQYAGSEQGRAGFSVEIPDQKRRLVVINADSNGGISLGHETGHAFYASLPYAQKKALLDTVSKTIRPDDFAQLKTRYEELFNQKRNEDGSYSPVPEAEQVKISDDYAAQEYLAENFSAYLNGVPIEKFGTPRGLADRIRVSIGAVLEKGGARRLTTDNSAAVRTELGYKPSAALAELYQNFIEARKLDNTTLTTINGEAAPVDVALPPVEVPTDRATIAPVSTNAPVSPLANIREVEAKPVVPGFKKGDPIGEIRDKDGMLIAEEAKVLRKNEDGTYEIEFIDPDTGKRLIATTDEASLVSPISPGKVDPNKTVFPASPVTPQTPFFAATAPTPPTAATTVAPKQVENVARPQSSVATPNLRPGAASAFVKKAPDTLHSANRQVLEGLMSAPRAEIPAVETDYYAAASPVQSPDAIVRAAQRKAADALEKSGEPNPFRAAFQKLFVPYRWSSYKLDVATNARLYGEGAPRQPGGIYGMSVDKVGQNLDLLRGLAKENSAVAETLSAFGVSQDYLASDALVSDFRTYLDNQAHGYGGDGRKLSLPADTRPGTITAQDPNFVPTALPANKRQLFNLLLNLEQQATRTPGMEFSARFAKQNGIDPLTVGFDEKGRPLTDNNALRAALLRNNFDPRLLNSAVENLPTENFTSAIKVRPDVAMPAADVAITQAGFMPETGKPRRPQGNDETRSVAAQYTQKAGIQAAPHDTYAPTNETTLKRIADFYENAKHEPEKPEVQKAYRALAEETRAQYDEMLANGIQIEPYEGKGEPYANSAAMLADIRDNKHLYFFLTKNAFGEGADSGNNALLEKSGIKINGVDLLYNDLFRAVHDYFGHTAEGFEFGPRGEYNAYLAHSRMFSDEAKPALAAETLAQNAWVNFGPQLRREDGSLPKAGDADFVPIAKRRFADQKNTVVPPELLQAADPQAAFMPEGKRYPEYTPDDLISKGRTGSGWIFPDGESKFAGSFSAHDELAKQNGFGGLETARSKGALRVWLDGEEKVLTLSVDALSELTPTQERAVSRLARDYDVDVRLDTGARIPSASFMPEDSQLEGFGESMREKMRAKMAKVEPSGYEEGDRLELPSGKIVEFVSDLLPKKGGARDGAQMAYVRFEDGMESSVYLDDLTKYYGPGATFMPETQFDAPKKLPDAIKDRTLTLVHKGPAGVGELDPARFGKSGITPRSELAGEPRVFFYVKGFENKSDPSQLRGNTYEIPVSGKRIYDADTDALDWTQDVNRQRADIMLKDAGYAGLIRTRGKGKNLFKQVEIFEKVSVDGTPVSETDVRTPRNRLETPEGRKVAAQLREKYGSTGAYFDRLERYKETGEISFMPEAPSPAVRVLDELKRANFISDKVAKAALGEFPTYLTSVADFITKQREKLVGGNLTSRDVAKAYMMTVASQGTGAIFVDTIAKKLEPLGIAFDPSATFRAEDGKKIRPEEAAAWWLGTADGKRALDNIEQGVVNPEDWAGLAAVRKAYGDDRFKTFRALDPKNLERIADVTSDLNASKGKSSDVLDAVQKLNGISTGKKGFVSHLLGLGDTPTIDAVEINFWLTGKGDIKTLNTKKAELARRVKETQSDARVSGELFRRIDDRIEALRGEVPGSDKVAPEVWAHILHHWLWDKAKGLETTHEGMYKAQGKFMPETSEMGRNEEFTKIPSDPEVVLALSSDKKDYVGAHRKLAAGTPVGLRIDIPAFTRTGKYVVTVHEKAGSSVGKRIGYDGIATVDEPTFFSNETGAQKIYDGGAKFPVATVEGLFNPSREIPSDISDWTPVGYDPKEHSFFYDKNSGEPVLSGDQAVSVGNTVFVKNPIYGDVADFRFMPETLDPAKVDTLPGEELARGIDIDPTPVNELNDGDAKIDWTAAFMPETISGVFPLIDQKLLEQIKSETPTIAAMHIDRMRVGSYKGIDLQGGMFYPAIKENVDKGVVWAFNSKGAASRSANRAAQNGGYVKLVLMAEGNIVGNRTFTNVWFNDVREAVASGDLKEKRALVELNRVRRSFASETDHRTKWETLEQAQKDIVDMPQMLRGSTYFQKTKVVTKADGEKVQYGSLLTKALTSVGFPDAVQLVSALEEPAFKGVPQGAAVAVLKFDPIKDRSEIKTAEEVGVPEHASYKYVLKGRPVARLENYSVVDADYPEIRRLIMSQQKKDFPVGRALIPETPAGTINYGLQDATIAPRQAAEAPLAREGVVSLPQRGLANATISPQNK